MFQKRKSAAFHAVSAETDNFVMGSFPDRPGLTYCSISEAPGDDLFRLLLTVCKTFAGDDSRMIEFVPVGSPEAPAPGFGKLLNKRRGREDFVTTITDYMYSRRQDQLDEDWETGGYGAAYGSFALCVYPDMNAVFCENGGPISQYQLTQDATASFIKMVEHRIGAGNVFISRDILLWDKYLTEFDAYLAQGKAFLESGAVPEVTAPRPQVFPKEAESLPWMMELCCIPVVMRCQLHRVMRVSELRKRLASLNIQFHDAEIRYILRDAMPLNCTVSWLAYAYSVDGLRRVFNYYANDEMQGRQPPGKKGAIDVG